MPILYLLWSVNYDIFLGLDRHVTYYARKVELELKLRGRIETGVWWDGDTGMHHRASSSSSLLKST